MVDSTYQSGCNCAGGPSRCNCEAGYICCSQKGNENRFGLCVKEENGCNRKTGLALKKIDSKYSDIVVAPEISGPSENYRHFDNLADGKRDSESKVYIYILFIWILVLFFGILLYTRR